MTSDPRRSALDRLLETLSWDGTGIRRYRHGGAGQENILTTEVLTALDFLPRDAFVGQVIRSAHGDSSYLGSVAAEAEAAQITVLGEDILLRPSSAMHGQKMTLQPDAVIEMPGTFVLVEAKRIRKPADFGLDQIAKSLAVAVREAGGKRPLVLIVAGSPPPYRLRTGGPPVSIEDSLAAHLPSIAERSDYPLDSAAILADAHRTVAWTTWDEIDQIARQALATFSAVDPVVLAALGRLVDSISSVIDRHR